MPSQQIQEIIILIGLQKITSNYVIRTILIITYLFVLFMKKKKEIFTYCLQVCTIYLRIVLEEVSH